jgi:glycosyltransferase involved in cell wall biosynthesis
MHVLFLPASYPNRYLPQSHIYIQDQAEALAAYGLKADVLAIVPISLKQVFSKRKLAFGFWRSEGRKLHTWLYQFPSIPKWRSLNNAIRLFIGKRLFKRYVKEKGRPDLIHVHIYLAGDLAVWIKETYGIPYVVTEHYTHFARGTLSPWQNRLAAKVYGQSSRNIAVSREFSRLLQERYSRNFIDIPNCVDTDLFTPDSAKRPSDTKIFLNVAYLEKKKNQAALIRAFKDAFHKDPKYHLVIAGNGPEYADLKHLVQQLGLEESVTLFGFAARDQVRDLLRASDFFVLSSRHETFGVVLIEAMSCGLPVIATKSGGPESIVTDPSLGILCDIDQEQLADAMKKATTVEFDRSRIRQHCIDHYSMQALAQRLLPIYEEVSHEA